MKNDGGPAFPSHGTMGEVAQEGMSLRDYFAAHAPKPRDHMPIEDHCAYRYRYADAMIRAREQ